MIQKTKCRNCRAAYELIWDDAEVEDWIDDFDEDDAERDDFEFEETDDPAYCPFCGTHCDYDE